MSSLNVASIIQTKRDGGPLEAGQIGALVRGYVRDEIPDYQMAALAMAVYFRGMTPAETAELTRQMRDSGTTLAWPAPHPPRVDKHSTGGVGDKVSLVLAPLLASCGLAVPMISGRGLGPTGGTLDKLESIPGFRTDLSVAEIVATTQAVGCVITGTTADVAPADRKLYRLRDVTATVESIPLITASILSKKLAENLDALVLDVKFGSGAFMKTQDRARQLARSLIDTGRHLGVKTSALLTDMNQPLGRMVGNAVEVDESVDVLAGGGPADLVEVTLALGAELLVATGLAQEVEEAERILRRQLRSGGALEKFRQLIAAQGGDPDALRRVAPAAEIRASRSGYVVSVETEQIGRAVILLGGGRRTIGDHIDHSVGLEMLVRVGDRVERDQPLVRVFAGQDRLEGVRALVSAAVVLDQQPAAPGPLIVETMRAE